MAKTYVGNDGVVFLVDVGYDISDADVFALKVQKPDGTLATWTGALSGTDYIRYVSDADDLDQAGQYQLQAYIESDDFAGLGDAVPFRVYAVYQ